MRDERVGDQAGCCACLVGNNPSSAALPFMNPFRDPLFYLGVVTAFAVAFFVTLVYVA